jgi:hypothetical protein
MCEHCVKRIDDATAKLHEAHRVRIADANGRR